ncbi:hypothetical protein [Candidatus Nitrosocosmicus sp. SS]|uniref:hypothetical protein n=1 Tax=Candidatus Nitrosocosmicus agrestis TaxID=2563600 RepID=UPI001331578F|nr:hypothetical protein [Candidatus Nitrosocosmicus sp. SS]
MLKTHNRHTISPKRRVSVMISESINKKLNILAKYYEMPKKYVIKMLIEEKIDTFHQCNKGVAN